MKLNNSDVDFGEFPNGEYNLPTENLEVLENNTVIWHFGNNNDIIKLALLSSHIKDMGGKSELYITYLPYSRMDRPNGHYSISIRCIADLINNMGFTRVTIREPHSSVSLDLIERSEPHWWCAERIDRVMNKCGAESVFYPDKGACDRYEVHNTFKYATGKKNRNFADGKIESMSIDGFVADKVLIIDDLCSRGGTFINAAKLLRDRGAKNIYLLVAHCENNIFTGDIFNYIDMVFTSTEMLDKDHPRITKIK